MAKIQFKRLSQTFRDRLPLIMEVASVPGISIAFIEDGDIPWTADLGVKEAGKPEPITWETLYQAGSLSKPVFAYAVLQMAESGLLDLDHPLADYLEEDYVPGEPRASTITARHVLSHTSGCKTGVSKKATL